MQSDRNQGVLKILLRKGVVEVPAAIVWPFPDTWEQEIPLSDASRAGSGGPRASLPLRNSPRPLQSWKGQIEQQEQVMAATAAYQMTCGDFDDLTNDGWRSTRG